MKKAFSKKQQSLQLSACHPASHTQSPMCGKYSHNISIFGLFKKWPVSKSINISMFPTADSLCSPIFQLSNCNVRNSIIDDRIQTTLGFEFVNAILEHIISYVFQCDVQCEQIPLSVQDKSSFYIVLLLAGGHKLQRKPPGRRTKYCAWLCMHGHYWTYF